MQIRTLTQVLALIGLVAAAPRPANTPLQWDDILLVGRDGAHQMIKDHEYRDLTRRGLLAPTSPGAPALPRAAPALGPAPLSARSAAAVDKRACDESSEVQLLSDTKFTGWDVAMSPVVGSKGGQTLVSVSQGYSVANTMSVSASVGAIIKAVLTVSMSVAYETSWTTTETSTLSYILPEQNYGLVVSQPMTRRLEGNYLTGCSDDPVKTPYTSDLFTDESYGNLAWVSGVVRLCNSTEYPVPYCNGDGVHE